MRDMYNLSSTQKAGNDLLLTAWRPLCGQAAPAPSDPYLDLVCLSQSIVRSSPRPLLWTCLSWCHFLSKSIKPLFVENVTCTSQEFLCRHVLSKLFLYTWDWVHYHKDTFSQIVLYLNMTKINYLLSNSQTLNQLRLQSYVEPNGLLISHESTLFGGCRDLQVLQWKQWDMFGNIRKRAIKLLKNWRKFKHTQMWNSLSEKATYCVIF